MDIKIEIEEEPFCSQDQRDIFSRDLKKEVKIETATNGNFYNVHIKTEIKGEDVVSNLHSQNKCLFDYPLMKFNKSSKDSEIKTGNRISGVQWCLERTSIETSNIKDAANQDIHSTEIPSFYKVDDSRNPSDLIFNENLQDDLNFNMKMNSPEDESKCQLQGSHHIRVSSTESNVHLETSDRKIVSIPEYSNTQNINKEYSKSVSSQQYRMSYKCDTSDSNCSSHLENHIWDNGSEEANKCDDMDKGLSHSSALKKHRLIYVNKNPCRCDICSKTFTALSSLRRHRSIHDGLKKHKCEICNKEFTRSSDLKRHKLHHDGIKPHKCEICNKGFTQLSSLKIHKFIHDGTKPQKCDVCNKRFTHLSSLNVHKLIHEGIKAHKCDICRKGFTQVSGLKIHKLIHDGIKPHKCDICNKRFTQLSELKTHKYIHDGIKPHQCEICNKGFTTSSNLKTHKFRHHKTTNVTSEIR